LALSQPGARCTAPQQRRLSSTLPRSLPSNSRIGSWIHLSQRWTSQKPSKTHGSPEYPWAICQVSLWYH
jgi:hypothetical protein